MIRRLLTNLTHFLQNVRITATATVDNPIDSTYVLFLYTDDTPDKLFKLHGVIYGEALHSRLDALLEEHQEPTLCPSIWVVTYHPCGAISEEEIHLNVA
jgi:hypothetical protein